MVQNNHQLLESHHISLQIYIHHRISIPNSKFGSFSVKVPNPILSCRSQHKFQFHFRFQFKYELRFTSNSVSNSTTIWIQHKVQTQIWFAIQFLIQRLRTGRTHGCYNILSCCHSWIKIHVRSVWLCVLCVPTSLKSETALTLSFTLTVTLLLALFTFPWCSH